MTVKLSENQVALILKFMPNADSVFSLDFQRNKTAREWLESGDSRGKKIAQIQKNDHFPFDHVGFQIVQDHPEYVLASVTPVPDWYEQEDDERFDLREITYQFVHDYKENVVEAVEDVRKKTGLRPRVFTAAMIHQHADMEPGTDVFETVANSMGYSPQGLEEVIDAATDKIQAARVLTDLT